MGKSCISGDFRNGFPPFQSEKSVEGPPPVTQSTQSQSTLELLMEGLRTLARVLSLPQVGLSWFVNPMTLLETNSLLLKMAQSK